MRSYKSGASRAAFIVLGGLLASAALVQVLARRAEKAHRPLGKILRVRGRAVHVVERGTGPCVVLLHGNGSMVEDFASTGLIDRLAENHRVLAFDRPGFGESDRDGGTWTPEREADLLAEVMQTLRRSNIGGGRTFLGDAGSVEYLRCGIQLQSQDSCYCPDITTQRPALMSRFKRPLRFRSSDSLCVILYGR